MGNAQEESKGTLPFFNRDGDESMKDELEKSCKCSYKTRIAGFFICMSVGWGISLLASILFFVKQDVVIFAVLYSLGQVVNIGGSCFLAGPVQQAKDMFKSKRMWLTIAYLTCILATIVMAVVLPDHLKPLIIAPLLLQFISYFFYTLSYIPFGRKILKQCCKCLIFK